MSVFKIEFTAQQFIEKSQEISVISHIEDCGIIEPLERLLWSLNNEAELHEEGARAAQERILYTLCNRLRMLRDFEQHPEIEDQEIVNPVFISGGPRTGSTKLHNLLVESGDFIYSKFWHVYSLATYSGTRDENPEDRIRAADEWTQWFETHAPGAKTKHYFQTHEPDEESFIFERCRFGAFMVAFFFVPSFIAWHAGLDPATELRFLEKALKYLQWQHHDGEKRPWILKYPYYFSTEPLIKNVFPDAAFLATHRDPGKVLASGPSLLQSYFLAYSNTNRNHVTGKLLLESQSAMMGRHVSLRDQHPEIPIHDVGYTELVKNSATAIEKIYTHLGMTLTDRARRAMHQWEQANRQHQHGVHEYRLEDYCLSREEIDEKCAIYIERYRQYF